EQDSPFPPGVDSWVRTFKARWIQEPRPAAAAGGNAAKGSWQIFAVSQNPLVGKLQDDLSVVIPAGGVALILDAELNQRQIGTMLTAVQKALNRQRDSAPVFFILLHHGGGAALAKTLFLEAPGSTVCCVETPAHHPQAAKWLIEEASTTHGFREVRYDEQGG